MTSGLPMMFILKTPSASLVTISARQELQPAVCVLFVPSFQKPQMVGKATYSGYGNFQIEACFDRYLMKDLPHKDFGEHNEPLFLYKVFPVNCDSHLRAGATTMRCDFSIPGILGVRKSSCCGSQNHLTRYVQYQKDF